MDAAAWCDICFLTTPPSAAADVAALVAGAVKGKIFVDTTNPLGFDPAGPFHQPPQGFPSVTHQLVPLLPGASVIKAFNTVGTAHHANAMLTGVPCDIPMAGDDVAAKQKLAAVIHSMGFVPIDAGGLRDAAVLENLAVFWIHLGAAVRVSKPPTDVVSRSEQGRAWARVYPQGDCQAAGGQSGQPDQRHRAVERSVVAAQTVARAWCAKFIVQHWHVCAHTL